MSDITGKKQDTKFKPGVSGNPAGRPAGARNVETLFRDAIAKIAKDDDIQDIEKDLVVGLLNKAKAGDLKAMEMYLDRLYGRPKQTVDTNVSGSLEIKQFDHIDKLVSSLKQ